MGLCVPTRGFKALKQIVKLHYKLGDTAAMLTAYRCASHGQLLGSGTSCTFSNEHFKR